MPAPTRSGRIRALALLASTAAAVTAAAGARQAAEAAAPPAAPAAPPATAPAGPAPSPAVGKPGTLPHKAAAQPTTAPAPAKPPTGAPAPTPPPLVRADVAAAEKLLGLRFSDGKRDLMLGDLVDALGSWSKLRAVPLPNQVPPALGFDPLPPGATLPAGKSSFHPARVRAPAVPARLDDLAFATVAELGELLRTRKVTSEALTRMYLERIRRLGPRLEAIITVTEARALDEARRADREIAAGHWRGPLHGVPYGLKDLFATRGAKTTWGSVPYKDQVIDEDAAVVRKLAAAGAVLVAKTAVGELAYGDVWFGGKSRNPWNPTRGSSGSSAGSAAGVAAGLFPFAIGTETLGSIVSPSSECGVTGLRPTFGRISRAGAMALSWSMDKVGVLCRAADDCAAVLDAVRGRDAHAGGVADADAATRDAPFAYPSPKPLTKMRVGYLKAAFEAPRKPPEPGDSADSKANDDAVLDTLRKLGVTLVAIELPKYPLGDMLIILTAEAAAAFDELTRSGKDDLMVRQTKEAWPSIFRASRFIPAVEYIEANRVRTLLQRDMAKLMEGVDVYVAPSEGPNLLATNLTGQPAVVLPDGFSPEGLPTSITFTGRLYGEAELLTVAKAYQDATEHHKKHPAMALSPP